MRKDRKLGGMSQKEKLRVLGVFEYKDEIFSFSESEDELVVCKFFKN